MKWITLCLGALFFAWFLRTRQRSKVVYTESSLSDIPEVSGLPSCSLDIGNGAELQEKITRSIKNGIADGLTPSMCAERIRKILKTQPLEWPTYDRWLSFILSNQSRYASAAIQEQFSEEIDREEQKILSYTTTVYGVLVCADKIQRMKDTGFKYVLWSCRAQDACCSTCAQLNNRRIPIDTFLRLYPIHPCCNGMPSVDESC